MHFDLLIKGGEVVNPGGQSGRLDIGIRRNRVAAIEPNIPAESAAQVVDASGQIVTPGLIDLHTHVYQHVTFWGIHADPVAARSGVTTWLDVGSAGAFNVLGFREYIARPSVSRLYALLNISSIGLTAMTGELANIEYCDVDLCVKLIEQNPDLLLGVKARIDRNTTRGTGLEPLRRARTAADRVHRPLMVHIGGGPPSLNEVLDLMRPGDILTHCFTGHDMRIIDDTGVLLAAAKRAWDSGIILDIGHGAGSFSFETAEKLIDAGHKPDVISTDIHQMSILGPLYDMPTCLSKFLALGMSLEEVIAAATVRAAAAMGMADEIGTLRVDALADVALFRILEGDFPFYDVHMNQRNGKQLLRNTMTIINGRELPRSADGPIAPWIELSENQTNLVARGHSPDKLAVTHCC
ncbi:MAG: amidohydrolase/deacetylase family metallohydrolase [Caldilineaceae bacterium]|nr:amidohydrolase/deacetylase family metallohydrolase [Caldilineaceae bacterium]